MPFLLYLALRSSGYLAAILMGLAVSAWLLRELRGNERRNAVFAALRAEVQHLAFGAPHDVLDELTLWKSALTALRTDPQAELPKVE